MVVKRVDLTLIVLKMAEVDLVIENKIDFDYLCYTTKNLKLRNDMEIKKVFRQDYVQTKSLVRAAKASGQNAVRRSKALDLTITYIEDGIIYEELPDGTKKQVGQIERNEPSVVLSKGMILHGKK